MKKDLYLKDLHAIQDMAGKIRTLNEAIQFGEDFQEDEFQAPETMEEPQQEVCANGECDLKKVNPEEQGLEELEKGGELDKIREITLRGMMTLNNTPEDPKFQALLKIFNICNKAVNDNSEENAQKVN